MSDKDAYIAKMKLQLDELNVTMQEFELRAHEAKEETRERYDIEIRKLREQSQLAHDKLEEIKLAGENSWGNLVMETEKVRDAFIKSFHYFTSQL